MQGKILIPTDFKIESLMLLRYAASGDQYQNLDVIFLHCTHLSDSITDLMFYSPSKIIQEAVTPEFSEACSILRNKFPEKIKNMQVRLFHSHTQAAFDMFLEANEVCDAIIPATYKLQLRKNSFDSIPFILRSGINVKQVDWGGRKEYAADNSVAALFLDWSF
jgi:hypothetical protein